MDDAWTNYPKWVEEECKSILIRSGEHSVRDALLRGYALGTQAVVPTSNK